MCFCCWVLKGFLDIPGLSTLEMFPIFSTYMAFPIRMRRIILGMEMNGATKILVVLTQPLGACLTWGVHKSSWPHQGTRAFFPAFTHTNCAATSWKPHLGDRRLGQTGLWQSIPPWNFVPQLKSINERLGMVSFRRVLLSCLQHHAFATFSSRMPYYCLIHYK